MEVREKEEKKIKTKQENQGIKDKMCLLTLDLKLFRSQVQGMHSADR